MKLPTLASVTGGTLAGANLKAFLTQLMQALESAGLVEGSRSTITTSQSLTASVTGLILVDATGGNVVLTLPTSGSSTDDVRYDVRRVDSSSNSVTVVPGGSDTIEGSTNALYVAANGCARIQLPAGGTNWRVLALAGATQAGSRTMLGFPLRGFLAGLTLSTAGSSATFSVAAGEAADSTNSVLVQLGSALNKTTSAWAVGSGNGGLDTGAIANNTWYHAYAIRRPDTGVVDAIVSLSASAPTLPTNYTQYRRLGALLTNGSAQWVKFIQDGDTFMWDTPVLDLNLTSAGATAATRTLASVPTGVNVRALLQGYLSTSGTDDAAYLSDLSGADLTPSLTSPQTSTIICNSGIKASYSVSVRTNTSAQIRVRQASGGATDNLKVATTGWVDSRGRFS